MRTGKSKKKLISSSEVHPVSPSLWQDSEKDCPTPVVDSCSPTLKSLNVFHPNGSSGKMSPEFCQRTEEGHLVPSSGRWGNWGMGGPTGSWTLNGSEHTGIPMPSRSDGDVCSLSDIVETSPVPPKFYLSPKACKGILDRAAKRGKTLPSILKEALETVAGGMEATAQEP